MGTHGGSSSQGSFLASERFDYDAYYNENPAALDADDQGRGDIKAEISMQNLNQGVGHGGGALLGFVGLVVGAVYALIDGIAFDAAIDAAIDEARDRNEAIASDIERAMDFRADIENKLAQFTTPQEQAMRERARMYGLQARAQGLEGAQALAVQQIAEAQYRNAVGAQLPQAITNAARESRADALARLSAIEAKYGITLASERQSLLEIERASQLRGEQSSSVTTGISALGEGVGSLFELITTGVQNDAAAQQTAFQSASDQTAKTGNIPDQGGFDAAKTGNIPDQGTGV